MHTTNMIKAKDIDFEIIPCLCSFSFLEWGGLLLPCRTPLYKVTLIFGTFLQTGQAAVTGSPPVEQKKTSTICHRVLPKSRILKNAKKKVYKVPPKMGTLYENVAGTL